MNIPHESQKPAVPPLLHSTGEELRMTRPECLLQGDTAPDCVARPAGFTVDWFVMTFYFLAWLLVGWTKKNVFHKHSWIHFFFIQLDWTRITFCQMSLLWISKSVKNALTFWAHCPVLSRRGLALLMIRWLSHQGSYCIIYTCIRSTCFFRSFPIQTMLVFHIYMYNTGLKMANTSWNPGAKTESHS